MEQGDKTYCLLKDGQCSVIQVIDDSYNKVKIDMEHIMLGHSKKGGRAAQSGIKYGSIMKVYKIITVRQLFLVPILFPTNQ